MTRLPHHIDSFADLQSLLHALDRNRAWREQIGEADLRRAVRLVEEATSLLRETEHHIRMCLFGAAARSGFDTTKIKKTT